MDVRQQIVPTDDLAAGVMQWDRATRTSDIHHRPDGGDVRLRTANRSLRHAARLRPGQYIQTLYRRAEQHASTFCRSRGEAQDKAWSGGKAVRKDLACGWRIVNFRRGSTLQLDHARSH